MNRYNDITIHKSISSPKQKEHHLLSCHGQYYEASSAMAELVNELQHHETEEEAIVAFLDKTEGKYTPEQVQMIINKYIHSMFTPQFQKHSFFYEKELLSAAQVDKYSDAFHFLFKRLYMITILTIALGWDVWFFLQTPDLLLFNNQVNLYMVAGMITFMLGSSFFHELGHASACKYFGVKHGGIGFGLYLTFPVLYTDVTAIWTLNCKQRCVVNLAGVYFQCFLLIPLLCIYHLTGYDTVRYLILIMNFGFLMTLNPFFKFDGYWMASDLLGVPNLRQRSIELLRYLYEHISRQFSGRTPYLLQIKPSARYGLLVYSIVVNLFMGGYFFYIIPTFLYRFVQTFPEAINELTLYLSNGMTPPFSLLRNIGSQLLFMILIGYMCWRFIQPLVKRYGKR